MANLNKVMLIGRLTRDPETRTFSNGGKVCNIGFAVNNRKKNQQTGEWEDEPCFLDCKAFDRETGRKLATLMGESLKKGQQIFIEGHLVMESWDDKTTGQKRTALKVYIEDMQFLEARADGAAPRSAPARNSAPAQAPASFSRSNGGGGGYDDGPEPPSSGGGDEEIPF